MSSDFKKFWVGQNLNLGSSFTQWAVPLLVYQLTHSAVNLGIATAATFLPYLLFGLIIGAWMDRVDRQRRSGVWRDRDHHDLYRSLLSPLHGARRRAALRRRTACGGTAALSRGRHGLDALRL